MAQSYTVPSTEQPTDYQVLEDIAGLSDTAAAWRKTPQYRESARQLSVYGLAELRIVKEPFGYGYVLTPNGKSLLSLITGLQFPLREVSKRARGKEFNGKRYASIKYSQEIVNALIDLGNRGWDYERVEVIEPRRGEDPEKITVYAIFPPSEVIDNVSAIIRVTFDEFYDWADAGYVIANNNLTTMGIWHCLRTFTNVVKSEKREFPVG